MVRQGANYTLSDKLCYTAPRPGDSIPQRWVARQADLPDYRLDDYLKHCALGRVGTFDEVAEMCALLASERAAYVQGEVVVMDGGV